MAGSLAKAALVLANAFIPIAVVLFSSGYFPYKPIIPGEATIVGNGAAPPIFDKVIVMVVDALRSDFVYSNNSGFLFTQELIRTGDAMPFTAHASSPTVTMPRIKAITTGSVPSFSDVILNIAESESMSTLTHQDTILGQLKRGLSGKLVMYGDDTWLNLFPNTFDRSDGTTSFFVSDFVEVDNNVTRHVPGELIRDDWSVMVLHYLGLDHIGHKAGPKSSHMIPKQKEMDAIVEDIFTAMQEKEHLQSTLLVLCGDHGMNEAGNHGGSSAGETSPALTFISSKLKNHIASIESTSWNADEYEYFQTVEQSDITPTLAKLLGVPIPLNSLGVFIPAFLDMWESGSDRLGILLENAHQILDIVKMAFPKHSFNAKTSVTDCTAGVQSSIEELECEWISILELLTGLDTHVSHDVLQKAIYRFLYRAQSLMSGAASTYKLSMLFSGSLAAAAACVFSLVVAFGPLRKSGFPGIFLVVTALLSGAIMFASSYVEEEQQYWYWIVTAWAAYLHIRLSQRGGASAASLTGVSSTIFLAILNRIMRRWNQTGQKFAGESDIVHGFLSSRPKFLWALILLTYVASFWGLVRSSPIKSKAWLSIWTILCAALSVAAVSFKVSFAAADSPELLNEWMLKVVEAGSSFSLVLQARVVFLGIFVLFVILTWANSTFGQKRSVTSKRLFHELLTLFLVTQSRATNIPLFLIFRAQASIIRICRLSGVEATINSILMQHMAFFAFGGSNAISSVDLSNAYNGVSDYNVVVVGLLTFISNWAGPTWWISATALVQDHSTPVKATDRIALLTFNTAFSLMSVMAACTMLRTHLFVWTVFSPKFLYSIAWALVNHIGLNLLVASSLSSWLS